MKISNILFLALFFILSFTAKAQDSAKVVQIFTELVSLCKNVDWADTNTFKLGTFYKAAPYIVYRGDDEKRKWKDVCNYLNPKEKDQVDGTCFKINGTLNQSTEYTIAKYLTQQESEGTWHVLLISYVRKGKEHHAAYAFLKIKDKYALGDID